MKKRRKHFKAGEGRARLVSELHFLDTRLKQLDKRQAVLDAEIEELERLRAAYESGSACNCEYQKYGYHECPSCGGDQSLAHGIECETCSQRRLADG